MTSATTTSTYDILQPVRYLDQKKEWPKEGRVMLAQYDEDSIVVYQAFRPSIAKYAVEHQQFGGSDFSFDRMSWIKTNFLWMMYRCGWASKKNQERVLAIRISQDGFKEILRHAYSGQRQKAEKVAEIQVRLQWDPDHSPSYGKLERRAIQLGLKGEILRKYSTEWVRSITDITDFVEEQREHAKDGFDKLLTPAERVYEIDDELKHCVDMEGSSDSKPTSNS